MKNKRMVLFAAFALLATAAFAQERISTSGGIYEVAIDYLGKNMGKNSYLADLNLYQEPGGRGAVFTDIKLTKGQQECVDKMLNDYNTASGDSFGIIIQSPNNHDAYLRVYCEFISATEYRYWHFLLTFR